jgi:hypothetical protein
VFVALFVCGTALIPEGTPLRMAVDTYQREALTVDVRHARLSYHLVANGVDLDSGFFGFGAERFFADNPAAMQRLRMFQGMRIAGIAMGVLGAAAIVGAFALPFALHLPSLPAMLGIEYGGIALGTFFMINSVISINIAPVFLARAASLQNEKLPGIAIQGSF